MSDDTHSPPSGSDAYPAPGYAWYVLVLLTLAYILSFLDRYILVLLVEPIKADFDLSDTQIGLLMGAAFAIFYATMGIPLGWLADNMKRRTLVSIGVLVWSLSTSLSGFAKGFTHLFVARVAVGAGEATLSPCAISLISDMFPERKRARAIAVYTSALSIASAIAYFGGGKLLAWANRLDTAGMFLFDGMKPWQIVFIIVGIPGLLISLLMIMVKEPKRRSDTGTVDAENKRVTFSETFVYFKQIWKPFLGVSLLFGTMTIIAYSQGFNAAMFERTWGWSAADYGVRNGIGLLVFGPTSVLFGGWLIDYYHAKGYEDGGLRVMRLGLFIMIPSSALFPLMPNGWAALICSFASIIGIALMSASGPPTILKIIPARTRGQAIAVYYMIISLAGLLLGPTSVGLITDYIFKDPAMLRYGVALVPAIFGLAAFIALPAIRRMYQARLGQEPQTLQPGYST